MSYEAGKGDTRRPTDIRAFSANYDAIFGTKIRGRAVELMAVAEAEEELKEETTGDSPSPA